MSSGPMNPPSHVTAQQYGYQQFQQPSDMSFLDKIKSDKEMMRIYLDEELWPRLKSEFQISDMDDYKVKDRAAQRIKERTGEDIYDLNVGSVKKHQRDVNKLLAFSMMVDRDEDPTTLFEEPSSFLGSVAKVFRDGMGAGSYEGLMSVSEALSPIFGDRPVTALSTKSSFFAAFSFAISALKSFFFPPEYS